MSKKKIVFKGSYLLVCIDGTGSNDWSNGTNSFTLDFYGDFRSSFKRYFEDVGRKLGGESPSMI